jgi:hypothetical protein
VEYVEQDFKVTKETTWDEMLREVLDFWNLGKKKDDKEEGEELIKKDGKDKSADPYNGYTLMLPNMHNIMCLN